MGLGFRFPQEQARAAGTSRTCADPLVFHARPEVLSETSLETWRVGGLSKCFFCRLVHLITPIRVPFRVLISLLVIPAS